MQSAIVAIASMDGLIDWLNGVSLQEPDVGGVYSKLTDVKLYTGGARQSIDSLID